MESGRNEEGDLQEILPQVCTDDILEFGLIPELVGRMPISTALTPLDEAGLIQVLTRTEERIDQAIPNRCLIWKTLKSSSPMMR